MRRTSQRLQLQDDKVLATLKTDVWVTTVEIRDTTGIESTDHVLRVLRRLERNGQARGKVIATVMPVTTGPFASRGGSRVCRYTVWRATTALDELARNIKRHKLIELAADVYPKLSRQLQHSLEEMEVELDA